MPDVYHSAHLPPVAPSPEVALPFATPRGSRVFQWDILPDRLAPDYDRCDVLYADLPWLRGFYEFNRRASCTDARRYRQFMRAVSDIVLGTSVPVILSTGRHAARYLPTPDVRYPVTMTGTGQAAVAYVYRAEFPDWADTTPTTRDLTVDLAGRFGCGGDFCCGYGSLPHAFAAAGGTFVASDYNAACVAYVASHAVEWEATA